MPSVEVTQPIVPGSVVVVRDLSPELEPGADPGEAGASDVADLLRQLRAAAGHDRFVVLVLDGDAGGLSVHGPDDMTAAIHRLVRDEIHHLVAEGWVAAGERS